jgi:DNA-binding CsgD family transcriptional regulator
LLVDVLAGRSRTLMFVGRISDAVADARGALDVARQIGYPAGEVLAMAQLSRTAHYAGDATNALAWATQAERALAAGAPDWTTRLTGDFIADVLVESGDLAAARRHTAQALAMSLDSGDSYAQASALEHLADLDLREGHPVEASARLRKATELAVGVGHRARICRCLDACGHLCATGARWADAVTIWTALKTVQDADGTIDAPLDARRRQEPLANAAQALGADRTRAAEQRGAAMTLETAADFAIMCTDAQEPTAAAAPAEGPQLSARERELVTLVAQGRTDAQIAGQLFISIRTVRSHLDRIRDKTGSRRRADLTRLALQAGLA